MIERMIVKGNLVYGIHINIQTHHSVHSASDSYCFISSTLNINFAAGLKQNYPVVKYELPLCLTQLSGCSCLADFFPLTQRRQRRQWHVFARTQQTMRGPLVFFVHN